MHVVGGITGFTSLHILYIPTMLKAAQIDQLLLINKLAAAGI